MSIKNQSERVTNKEFATKLENRTKQFAIDIIKMVNSMKNTQSGQVIGYQLLKSATSIGANYREANRSVSKADFKNKISICTKESSETQYWLELILESGIGSKDQVIELHKECSELLALLNAIYQTCKEKKNA